MTDGCAAVIRRGSLRVVALVRSLARWINTQIRTSAVQRAFPGVSRCKGLPLRGKRRPQTAPSRAQTTTGRVVRVSTINTCSCRVAYRRPAATNKRVRVIARSRRHVELTVSFMRPVDPWWYVRACVCRARACCSLPLSIKIPGLYQMV